ncbi:hypothetical protein AYK24_01055 [Thermoplasmatales archaeon SG8-52-4]|nr:MAG: hypothetical protein AYK24_01055 [Thermoplasmatales archaeon SG8-52-4]
MKKNTFIIISIILLINVSVYFSDTGFCKKFSINTLYVGGNGIGNYSSIQEAINASNKGDLIFVFKGIYNENLNINKSISLTGENKDTTIINGKNKQNIITINASNVNISRFTIQNGQVSGIFIKNVESCNIFQNNINANKFGIQIAVASNIKIFNNTILNNYGIGINATCNSSKFISYNTTLCNNNSIFHNNFINNTQHGYDIGNISWSYNNQGNYYDDYTSLDKNNDGIGEKPYLISNQGSVDNYPLMMPFNGKIRIKDFYVDEGLLYKMLVISLIIAIIFVLPIGYIWYRKYHKKKM